MEIEKIDIKKLIDLYHELRFFAKRFREECHVDGCTEPTECPETHEACKLGLNASTALAWDIANFLDNLASRCDYVVTLIRDQVEDEDEPEEAAEHVLQGIFADLGVFENCFNNAGYMLRTTYQKTFRWIIKVINKLVEIFKSISNDEVDDESFQTLLNLLEVAIDDLHEGIFD